VFAVGNVAYEALAKLLLHLGAGPGGHTHVVVTDVREELVVYVNGEQRCSAHRGTHAGSFLDTAPGSLISML
jgi:hypothetical protein